MYRYLEGDPCPVCEGVLRQGIEDKYFKYKDKTFLIEDYPFFKCEKCGEKYIDEKTIKEFEPRIRDFQKKVDGLLTSDEIRAVRKKLSLTQEKLAECLGVSRLTIHRYESGQQTQTISQDIHIKMLRSYPEVLKALTPSCVVEPGMLGGKDFYKMEPVGNILNYKGEISLKHKENKVA